MLRGNHNSVSVFTRLIPSNFALVLVVQVIQKIVTKQIIKDFHSFCISSYTSLNAVNNMKRRLTIGRDI